MPIVEHVPPDVPAATSGQQSALVTAAVALLLSRKDAPPLAYIASGLGTLIGADLTNLDKVPGLGVPADRRCRNVRWHLSYRYPRGAAGEPLHATPCTLNRSRVERYVRLLRGSESATSVASGCPDGYILTAEIEARVGTASLHCARTWRGEPENALRAGVVQVVDDDHGPALSLLRSSLIRVIATTLAPVVDVSEKLTGCAIGRAYVDKGYRGHDTASPRRVFISGQKRGIFGIDNLNALKQIFNR